MTPHRMLASRSQTTECSCLRASRHLCLIDYISFDFAEVKKSSATEQQSLTASDTKTSKGVCILIKGRKTKKATKKEQEKKKMNMGRAVFITCRAAVGSATSQFYCC